MTIQEIIDFGYDPKKIWDVRRGRDHFDRYSWRCPECDSTNYGTSVNRRLFRRHKRIIEVKNFIPRAKIILLAAPAAEAYYPKIGMQKHEHCYFIDSVDELK